MLYRRPRTEAYSLDVYETVRSRRYSRPLFSAVFLPASTRFTDVIRSLFAAEIHSVQHLLHCHHHHHHHLSGAVT